MTVDDGLRHRMVEDADEAPPGQPPAPPHRASRHRRITVAAVVALALVGGFVLARRTTDEAARGAAAVPRGAAAVPRGPAAAPAPPDLAAPLPWLSTMVARDGTAVTVYAGTGDEPCKELSQPQATVTEQDGAHVVIAVQARIVDASDCTTSGSAVPLVVPLRNPLGDRVLRDAAASQPPPTYFERDLPDLLAGGRWSPHPSHWAATDQHWYQGYNGPAGSSMRLTAQPTAGADLPPTVATIPIGSRQGTVTTSARGSWSVWWEAGEVTYSLLLMPAEGGAFTLREFKRELARLKWR
ncbi:hypothetical protein [Micromonospora sp. SL4-19]|uniref:hypothetical protein n=1 Tax=Micromonospora sp. SL4-19 TaxID=3399129 RepID=UPI003A4DB930